jgi:hypothetical protein
MHDDSFAIHTRCLCKVSRTARILLSVMALVAGMVTVQAATPQSFARDRLASLSIPGIKWDEDYELELAQVPAYARPFQSSETAVHVARSLAVHTDIFQLALSLPGKIVLSGLDSNWHWLAQIESTQAGARGQVSALRTRLPASGNSTGTAYSWMPVHAVRHFSHRTESAAGTVWQQVYSVALAPAELTAYLRRQLRAEGWVGEPQLAAAPQHSAWRRNETRLMLFPQQSPGGSSLFVHIVDLS